MSTTSNEILVLAGDIGGTKTNLGLFAEGKRRPIPKVLASYPSRQASDLESIVSQFLHNHHATVTTACFGVAGPVRNGNSQTTNLPWRVSEARLKRCFKWSQARLINDLAATAQAIPLLSGREIMILNKKRAAKKENVGLVAPGTGLGMALLVWSADKCIPVPSEGGHMDFGPNSEEETALWHYLHRRFGHVSAERVLSGPGLFNIYSWLLDSGRYKAPLWLQAAIEEKDPPKAVAEAAINKKTPIAVAAMNKFTSILGAVAGNIALAGTTTGGMYLGGGIPPKIIPYLQGEIFMKSFVGKGRFKPLLEKIPVRIILNDKAALLGAAHCAFSMSK